MNYYLNKHLKSCGYTHDQIIVGIKSRKRRNITFTLVIETCDINYTGKRNLLKNYHRNNYQRNKTKKVTEQ